MRPGLGLYNVSGFDAVEWRRNTSDFAGKLGTSSGLLPRNLCWVLRCLPRRR
jgi:hypothetical protein